MKKVLGIAALGVMLAGTVWCSKEENIVEKKFNFEKAEEKFKKATLTFLDAPNKNDIARAPLLTALETLALTTEKYFWEPKVVQNLMYKYGMELSKLKSLRVKKALNQEQIINKIALKFKYAIFDAIKKGWAINPIIEKYKNLLNNELKSQQEEPEKQKTESKKRLKEEHTALQGESLKTKKIKTATVNIATTAKDHFGENDLLLAAGTGQLETVKKLITNGADVNTKNKYGETPLILAADNGYFEIVKYLIENGANVNIQDEKDGETALHKAVSYGDLRIVKYLIANGADKNTKNNNGETAHFLAIQKGYFDIIEYLDNVNIQDKEDDKNALHKAASNGDLKTVKDLIEKGADVNKKNKYGETPLLLAASKGYLEIVKYLIEKGANVNIQNNDGETPLLLAASNGYLEIVKYLIEKGANVNIQDKEVGETPLLLAAKKGHLEIVKELIAKGAKINIQNNDGKNALPLAAGTGYLEIVKALIANGANVNTQDEDGKTALHKASKEGHLEIVKYLIEKGANVNIQNKDGKNAYDLAKVKEIKDFLLSCMKFKNCQSEEGLNGSKEEKKEK